MMSEAATVKTKTDEAPTKVEPQIDETVPQMKQDDTSQKIADLEEQVRKWREQCFRAVAELDNARKRFVKEKEDVRFHTTRIICMHIIELFDTFRMGLNSAEKQQTDPKVLEGFQMILQQFRAQLKILKIEEFCPQNEAFDPHVHDAVSHAYSDTVPEDHIVETVRNGYKYDGRLLRAAGVVVSKGKAPQTEAQVSQ